jgi:hypothetical protein
VELILLSALLSVGGLALIPFEDFDDEDQEATFDDNAGQNNNITTEFATYPANPPVEGFFIDQGQYWDANAFEMAYPPLGIGDNPGIIYDPNNMPVFADQDYVMAFPPVGV